MKTRLSLGLITLLLASGAAFAQSAPTPAAEPRATVEPAVDAKTPDAIDHICLRETGTLIRPRHAKSNERCPSHVYGRVWTQDELRSTGTTDIVQALRMLDPSIH